MDADSGITAKWKPYPEYKDSDLEWLGDVPKHWEVKRLKFIAIEPLKYGANESAELNDQELPRYIRITDIKNDGTLIENTFRSLPEENAKPYLLKQGDLLFARSGATVGKSFMYQATWGRACYAGYLIRLRINQSVAIPEFVSYFANSLNYWVWLSSIFIQATIQNVSAERYSNLFLAIPRLDEQHSIAAFLDRETAKIDALIAKKKQLIKLLQEKRAALISHAVTKGLDPSVPMKDSGVEWLGDVPEHWDVKRLRFCFEFLNSKRVPISSEERGKMVKEYPYYGASGIIDYVENYIFDETLILIAEDGANLFSRSTPLAFVASGKYWVNNHAHILRPVEGPIEYFSHLLAVIVYDPWISGSAQPKLTKENLGSIYLPVPPKDERKTLNEYLNSETTKFDKLNNKILSSIEKLKEYRATIISVAVTGKIDVRNWFFGSK